jgi:tRNA-dihydrouridine synthase
VIDIVSPLFRSENIALIVNGDCWEPQDVVKMFSKFRLRDEKQVNGKEENTQSNENEILSKCDSILIARGALRHLGIFAQAKQHYWKEVEKSSLPFPLHFAPSPEAHTRVLF